MRGMKQIGRQFQHRSERGRKRRAKLQLDRTQHRSLTMTTDRYGHLFPRGDDGAEMAAAERTFIRMVPAIERKQSRASTFSHALRKTR